MGARLRHVSALLGAAAGADGDAPARATDVRRDADTRQGPEAWRDTATWLCPVLGSAAEIAGRLGERAAALDPVGAGDYAAPPRIEYACPPGALFAEGGPLRPLDIGSAELTYATDLLDAAATDAAQSGVIGESDPLAGELHDAGRTLRAGAAALHLAATALGELAAHQLHDYERAGGPATAAATTPVPRSGEAIPGSAPEAPPLAHPARELAAATAPLLPGLFAAGMPFPPLPAALPKPAERPADSSPRPATAHVELDPRDRVVAVLGRPAFVGNLPGLDWDTRIAANAISVRAASQRERLAGRAGTILIGRFDAMDRLRPDPVTGVASRRRFVAFDPAGPGTMIELVGSIPAATGLLLYVPGTGTNLEMSHVNTEVAEHFVEAGRGRLACLVFLGGKFPQNMWAESGDPVFTLAMAPLVAEFSWDVQEHLRAVGREGGDSGTGSDRGPGAASPLPVTVVGHSFGGGVVGTAETLGLYADRVAYVASPSAGIGVTSASQWRNTAPAVRRYSLTVPGDPIELMQIRNGLRYPNSSDIDIMDGVRRLDTGFYSSGEVLFGTRGHGGVFDRDADAFWQIAAVVLGAPVVDYAARSIVARGTASLASGQGRLFATSWQQIRAQLGRPKATPPDVERPTSRDSPVVVEGPGPLVTRDLG
ncbi:hypothetical protein [Dietzia sp.]|uniref:hypothetical protein n=1 Tax=Dietzia sp. TaxID=1871616 RepID=UPI002FDB61BC